MSFEMKKQHLPVQTPRWKAELLDSEAVVERCFVKKLFIKILQNSQENTCARVSSCRLQAASVNFRDNNTFFLWEQFYKDTSLKFVENLRVG